MNVKKLLKKRNSDYGRYVNGVKARVDIMKIITNLHESENKGKEMSPYLEDMIHDVVNKIVRIAVTPVHVDSWRDVEGYSRLTRTALEGKDAFK